MIPEPLNRHNRLSRHQSAGSLCRKSHISPEPRDSCRVFNGLLVRQVGTRYLGYLSAPKPRFFSSAVN